MGGSRGKKGRRKSKISGTCSSMTPANCNVIFFFPSLKTVLGSGIVAILLIFFLPFLFWPLQEAIRVILGNLDDLHAFSTDHYLSVYPFFPTCKRKGPMTCICWALLNLTFLPSSAQIFSWSTTPLSFAVLH